MNIEIENLSLQLPAGFEQRAPRIARLLAEALTQQLHSSLQPAHAADSSMHAIPQLRLAPLKVQAQHSDRAIAWQLASGVAQALASQMASAPAPQPSPRG